MSERTPRVLGRKWASINANLRPDSVNVDSLFITGQTLITSLSPFHQGYLATTYNILLNLSKNQSLTREEICKKVGPENLRWLDENIMEDVITRRRGEMY